MTTLKAQYDAIVNLLVGKQLTVIAAASSTALVCRYQGETLLDTTAVAAGTTTVFGEYLVDVTFKITCLTGSLTYSQSLNTGPKATQTNDAAPAGAIGEYKTATVAVGDAVPETTATPVNVTSLALTAGDWDVSGVVNRDLAGVTATRYTAAISPTANTVPAQAGGSGVAADSVVGQFATFGTEVTGGYTTAVGPVRVSLAATTTIYLVAADVFSAGTVGLSGTLRARRIR